MRVRTAALAALGLTVFISGCDLAAIPGDGPLRYRDEIFTTTTRISDVPYRQAVNQQGTTVNLALDVYEPVGDDVEARPLIVWVHGGSFCCGDRRSPEIVDEATYFAKRGYVSASISYRLSPRGCTSVSAECLTAIAQAREDAQAAIRFLRENAADYGIDPERVAIAGTSAGAITALGVNYLTEDEASQVDAAVSLSGAVIATSGVDEGDPRALLFHGTADQVVPYAWAQATAEAGGKVGVPTYLISWEGEGHVPYAQHRTQILDLTTNFLYRRLDAANAAQ